MTQATTLRISLLGPFQVSAEADGEQTMLTGRQRPLLAALALERGTVVSSDRLIEAVWNEQPPPAARTTLRSYVNRLRGSLRALLGGAEEVGTLLRSTAGGYRLDVLPEAVDLHHFRQLSAEAGRTGDAGEERALLRRALGLWRGEALCDVDSDTLRREVAAVIDEEYVQAAQRLIELDLRGGNHDEAIALLRRLTTAHPLHERFWHQLLLALERVGRKAEALAQYEQVRSMLADELGVAPGEELRRFHQRLVSAVGSTGTGPERPAPARRAGPGREVTPSWQLPRDIPSFSGREKARKALDLALRAGPHATPPLAIEGPAGIGKTALAVFWAHRAAEHFPDGQLYLDLHGFGPEPALDPRDALASLLRGIGVPDSRVPDGLADRLALFRSGTKGRRLLVLLDNAAGSAQVRPLLPAQSCAVVVTSRRALRDLVAHDGARRLRLGPLDQAAADRLLAHGLGPARAAADPAGRAALARGAGGLPLALRLAVEFAQRYPDTSLSELAAALTDDRVGQDLLDFGGETASTGLREAWLHTWRHAAPAARRMAALLATPAAGSGPVEMPVDEAALRAGVPWREAFRALDELASLHLIEHAGPFCFRIPALTRRYAAEIGVQPDRDGDATAVQRPCGSLLQRKELVQ
ncbi:AfsR/SARP family transcriptional regulator [Streptomyces sp. Ru87]|uniref:AfsR/SARP family transcriptional regulator n=1 Tax=Streptomyces sp. Ru87 TaxID=2044307 RepID=UPI0015D4DFAF|nr:AfsR/SARP family transcriptional regulator [Streptomyces sp. Ru87]